MAFEKQTPPPIIRGGREKVTLDEKEGKALLAALIKDKDADNPWQFETKEFNSKAAAQARVLWYRQQLTDLFDEVEVGKQIRGRVVEAEKIGGTKGKYRFGLCYRDLADVPENGSEPTASEEK